MRHRRGTPGLTPYRLRTIEAGYPRRRRPARHLRRGKSSTVQPGTTTDALPGTAGSQPVTTSAPRARRSTAAAAGAQSAAAFPSGMIPQSARSVAQSGPVARPCTASRRRWLARRVSRARLHAVTSQVAMGLAGAITLALLIVGGYQAAAGAAVVLGMF